MRGMRSFLLLIALASLLCLSPVQVDGWVYKSGRMTRVAALPVVISKDQISSADLDVDGQSETLSLIDGRLLINNPGGKRWESPTTWSVEETFITDLNRDGWLEAVLLVRRPFAPWPVDRYLPHPGRIAGFHDSRGQSSHLILIGGRAGAFREVWAGSALAEPVLTAAAADLDGDGRQELVTLDGLYNDPPGAASRSLSIWEWNGFGFTLLARQPGRYHQLSLGFDPSQQWVIVTGQ